MELIKKNEQYSLTDEPLNGWTVTGTVSKGDDLNIWVSVVKDTTNVGNISYSKNLSGRANITFDVEEVSREEFSDYADNLIDNVLTYFK